MAQYRNRMGKYHPWTGITHDVPYLLTVTRHVAMNRTLAAGGLAVAKTTTVQSAQRVLQQRITSLTQSIGNMPIPPAIYCYHQRDSTFFAFNAAFHIRTSQAEFHKD